MRRYLRYSLRYRDLEELMTETGLSVDPSTIAGWVLRYAPILNQRMRRHAQTGPGGWMKVTFAGQASGIFLDRASDSEGNTFDFLLSPHRNRVAAKHFLQLALWRVGHLRPRVITVDGHPAYPSVIAELKQTGQFPKSCRFRRSRYMNNVIEQDHRFVKKRIVASQGFRSVEGALNTM